ncbi:S-protein homolog 3 [Linum perenne]
MAGGIINNVIVLLIIMTTIIMGTEARFNPFDPRKPKVTVTVVNSVGEGRYLDFHCKSGDDDLGRHLLEPNGSFKFTFRPNMVGGTVFYCAFSWEKGSGVKWFDVYLQSRDYPGRKWLEWFIRPNGPCKSDQGGETCYHWNH